MAAKFEHYKAELEKFLNKKNKFTEYLELAEKKTGAPRLYIFLGKIFVIYILTGAEHYHILRGDWGSCSCRSPEGIILPHFALWLKETVHLPQHVILSEIAVL